MADKCTAPLCTPPPQEQRAGGEDGENMSLIISFSAMFAEGRLVEVRTQRHFLLVHLQDRLCGMSYGSRHETSDLRTSVVAKGARGSHHRAARVSRPRVPQQGPTRGGNTACMATVRSLAPPRKLQRAKAPRRAR